MGVQHEAVHTFVGVGRVRAIASLWRELVRVGFRVDR